VADSFEGGPTWAGDWFDDVRRHMKEAAGPSAFPDSFVPLTPEAELEDAPRPRRHTGPETTPDLLPYGTMVRTQDGVELVLERITFPPLPARHGSLAVCDPMSLGWQGPPIQVQLGSDQLPVELAVLRRDTPLGPRLEGVKAVIGDVSTVMQWVPAPDSANVLEVDKGLGAFLTMDAFDDAVAAVDQMVREAEKNWLDASIDGLIPVEVDGSIVGVLFDSQPAAYEVLLGIDTDSRPVALMVDLVPT
jgi:hypothetical protein